VEYGWWVGGAVTACRQFAIKFVAAYARIYWVSATFDGENSHFLALKDWLGAGLGSERG
jgi:hypothetical protein